jgi:transposase
MLKVNHSYHNQNSEILRKEALKAAHPRTRERFMALYEVAQGKSASKVAKESGRNPQTVMSWVHRYNDNGADALIYERSGGHPPFFALK